MWLKKFLPFRLVSFFIQLKAAPGCSREKLNPVKLVITPWIRRYWWTKYRFQFIFYCIRTNHSVLLLLSTILFVWLLCRNHQLIHQSKLSWGFSQVLFQGESLWHLRGFYFELLGVTFFLGRLLLRNLLQILFQERRYFSCFSYVFGKMRGKLFFSWFGCCGTFFSLTSIGLRSGFIAMSFRNVFYGEWDCKIAIIVFGNVLILNCNQKKSFSSLSNLFLHVSI